MRVYLLPVFMLLFAACNNDAPRTESATTTHTVDEVVDKGKALFQQNCATCHNIEKDASGPALGGVLQRWNNDTTRLKAFIRNPAKLISEGDPSAVKTAEAFKPVIMAGFPNLDDKELNDLIAYIQNGH